MKNKANFVGICAAFLLLLSSFPVKGQGGGICNCPFTIVNNLDCGIYVHYDVVDASCLVACTAASVFIGDVGSGSNVLTISSPCCSAGMDVYVVVSNPSLNITAPVNGVSQPACNSGYLHSVDTGTVGATCSTSGNYNISWGCNSVTINP
jgi:hypothetical protein